MAKKRSKKGWAKYNAARLGDLGKMARSIAAGRLADNGRLRVLKKLSARYAAQGRLLRPEEIKTLLKLTQEERDREKLYTIEPIDCTKAELATESRRRRAERMKLRRRKAGKRTRAEYRAAIASDQPWIELGISRETYYKRKRKSGLGSCPPHETRFVPIADSVCREEYLHSRYTPSLTSLKSVPIQHGIQGEVRSDFVPHPPRRPLDGSRE
jgi:hypothetical protein